jgi:F5/8 type C domain-containing protein
MHFFNKHSATDFMTGNLTSTLLDFIKKAIMASSRLIDSNAVILLFLISFSLVSFQDGLLDYPRNDHIGYLKHEIYFQHPAEWCEFSASYSRTRWLGKGDEYLFRPGHMVYLCVENVFFEKKPIVAGTISVVSAGIAAFILFLVCSVVLGSRAGGLLASLCWLIFFPGMDLILWRHISPYMLSLIFGFGGIYYFYSTTNHNAITKHALATILLLLASLFHEITVVALSIFIGVKFFLYITARFKPEHNIKFGKTLISILPALLAITLFTTLNIINFIKYGGSLFGPVDKFLDKGYLDFLLRSSHATAYLMGLSIFALLIPFDVSLAFNQREIIHWAFPAQGIYLFFLWFCTICAIAIMATGAYLLFKARNPHQPHRLVGFSLCFLISGFLGMGFLRGGLRGIDYLQAATYYFSFYAWCWIIVLAFMLRWALDNKKFWPKNRRSFITIGSSLLAIIYIGINFYLVADFTKNEYQPRAVKSLVMNDQTSASSKHKNYSSRFLLRGAGPPSWHAERFPQYPQWVKFKFKPSKKINILSIEAQTSMRLALPKRAPKHFIFQGSNDSSNWTDLIEVKDAGFTSGKNWRTFKFANEKEYSFYRLYILANGGDPSWLTIQQIDLN